MLTFLWNLCKLLLLKIAAISWNAIKRVQGEQPQQLDNTIKAYNSTHNTDKNTKG
jgi:hypothetical protein